MKSISPLVLLFMFLPLLLHAQKTEIAFNEGMAITTVPLNKKIVPGNQTWNGKVVPTLSIGVLRNTGSWQWGLAAEMFNASITVRKARAVLQDYPAKYTYKFSRPSIPLLWQINKKIKLPKSHFYFGASAGLSFNISNSIRPAAGVQAGYTHNFSKRTYVNVNTSARYLLLKYGSTSAHMFTFPLTVGLHLMI